MAIPRECKRLAEVDFPIAVVSKHAAREKSIRHGHPSTLHLWWARRPLASSRAMLLAMLLPDPCDEHCPPDFREKARDLLAEVQGKPGPDDLDLRGGLLKFIGDFANWDLAAHPRYLAVGRGLVHAAHPEEPPLVVDPFAGGGSIPLEALRLGCEAFASDLNPVACLILKGMLEDIPRYGPGLADELRKAGAEIKAQAESVLAEFYPPDTDGARPIAYLWARTIRCETPGCGAEIPLMRSVWLSKKGNRRRALCCQVQRPDNAPPRIEFAIAEPRNESEVQRGTVSRAKATCPACNIVLGPERVRAQLGEQRGGADVVFDGKGRRAGGARLLAVVTLVSGQQGRQYRLPEDRDYDAVRTAMQRLAEVAGIPSRSGLSAVPDEATPAGGGSGAGRAFSLQRYGMMQWGDLFTARQKLALITAASHVDSFQSAPAVAAMVVGRCADYWSSGAIWAQEGEFVAHTFGRNALPIVWDFAETVPFGDASGNWDGAIDWVARVVESGSSWVGGAQVQAADATESPLPDDSSQIWFTDPPYYDAIPYADLSDFFFVWLKRALPGCSALRDPYEPENRLTPKTREAVQDDFKLAGGHPKDRAFFEACMATAFAEGRRVLVDDGIGCIVFAHKSTEGWEALLTGVIRAGWTVTGSWPIATERPGRLRSIDSAALATSVHLVCRPRPDNAPVGDWAGVLRELPGRVGDWLERLQSEGVRGADLVFACIGPALEIYSRYSKVVDAEDREIPLGGDPEAIDPYRRGYLAYVWESVGRAALQQVLGQDEEAGGLEEDARLVSIFLWTIQSTNGANNHANEEHEHEEDTADEEEEDEDSPGRKAKGYTLIFDVARRFAQPLGIHLDDWEGRIIETKKGVVRLLPIAERAKQLFGEDGAQAAADRIEKEPASAQLSFFPEVQAESKQRRGRRKITITASDESISENVSLTTLDRLHVAMLLQSSGRANALRALLGAEQERGPEFLRLANALSALYPRESEEKRLLDAMLLAVPR